MPAETATGSATSSSSAAASPASAPRSSSRAATTSQRHPLDRNNYHQFQPLLYQVATCQLAPSDIAYSLRDLFRDHENVDVKLGEVAGGRSRDARR